MLRSKSTSTGPNLVAELPTQCHWWMLSLRNQFLYGVLASNAWTFWSLQFKKRKHSHDITKKLQVWEKLGIREAKRKGRMHNFTKSWHAPNRWRTKGANCTRCKRVREFLQTKVQYIALNITPKLLYREKIKVGIKRHDIAWKLRRCARVQYCPKIITYRFHWFFYAPLTDNLDDGHGSCLHHTKGMGIAARLLFLKQKMA